MHVCFKLFLACKILNSCFLNFFKLAIYKMNGKITIIEHFDDSSSRWIVILDGKPVAIRQENIKRKDRTVIGFLYLLHTL